MSQAATLAIASPETPLVALARRHATELSALWAVDFTFYDLSDAELLWPTHPGALQRLLEPLRYELLAQAQQAEKPFLFAIDEGLHAVVLPLGQGRRPVIAAVAVFRTGPTGDATQPPVPAEVLSLDHSALASLRAGAPYCDSRLLIAWGHASIERLAAGQRTLDREHEIADLAAQLGYTYEELTLLHRLTKHLQISRAPEEVHRVALAALCELLQAGALAYLPESPDETPVIEGPAPLSLDECRRLIERHRPALSSQPLVHNHVDRTPWGHDFPRLRNLVLIPLREGGHVVAWMLALNHSAGREFGTVEAGLMSSVGAILATHARNVALFRERDELFVGVVRALSSAIDAKDPYTCGHSERVALIARRLGRQMGLADPQLQALYLCGLLHDVGKIGINDEVLKKPGRLTPEEYDHIKQHVEIGYAILSGLKQLRHVLPGVRHHHESYNGKGYPHGLRGDEIPLIARILAVADAYDAMASDRPYRDGLSVQKAEEILRRGADDQWDGCVIEALFQCKPDIEAIGRARPDSPTQLARRSAGTSPTPAQPFTPDPLLSYPPRLP